MRTMQRPPQVLLNSSAAGRLLDTDFDATVALRPHRGIDQVANAVLRKEDWEQLDQAVIGEPRRPVAGIQTLRNRDLIQNLGGLGAVISQYETLNEMSGARQSMRATETADKDRGVFKLNVVPVPITWKDFSLDIRQVQARQRNPGADLDTTYAQLARRQVDLKLENTLFYGGDVVVNGNNIPGLTNHPNVNPVTLGTRWPDLSDFTNAVDDVRAMKAGIRNDEFEGAGMVLFIDPEWEEALDADYKTQLGETLRERIMRIEGIDAIESSPALNGNDEAVLVFMAPEVVDLAIGEDVMPVQWEVQGGLGSEHKVMAAMAPRVKTLQSGKSGVSHLS